MFSFFTHTSKVWKKYRKNITEKITSRVNAFSCGVFNFIICECCEFPVACISTYF